MVFVLVSTLVRISLDTACLCKFRRFLLLVVSGRASVCFDGFAFV